MHVLRQERVVTDAHTATEKQVAAEGKATRKELAKALPNLAKKIDGNDTALNAKVDTAFSAQQAQLETIGRNMEAALLEMRTQINDSNAHMSSIGDEMIRQRARHLRLQASIEVTEARAISSEAASKETTATVRATLDAVEAAHQREHEVVMAAFSEALAQHADTLSARLQEEMTALIQAEHAKHEAAVLAMLDKSAADAEARDDAFRAQVIAEFHERTRADMAGLVEAAALHTDKIDEFLRHADDAAEVRDGCLRQDLREALVARGEEEQLALDDHRSQLLVAMADVRAAMLRDRSYLESTLHMQSYKTLKRMMYDLRSSVCEDSGHVLRQHYMSMGDNHIRLQMNAGVYEPPPFEDPEAAKQAVTSTTSAVSMARRLNDRRRRANLSTSASKLSPKGSPSKGRARTPGRTGGPLAPGASAAPPTAAAVPWQQEATLTTPGLALESTPAAAPPTSTAPQHDSSAAAADAATPGPEVDEPGDAGGLAPPAGARAAVIRGEAVAGGPPGAGESGKHPEGAPPSLPPTTTPSRQAAVARRASLDHSADSSSEGDDDTDDDRAPERPPTSARRQASSAGGGGPEPVDDDPDGDGGPLRTPPSRSTRDSARESRPREDDPDGDGGPYVPPASSASEVAAGRVDARSRSRNAIAPPRPARRVSRGSSEGEAKAALDTALSAAVGEQDLLYSRSSDGTGGDVLQIPPQYARAAATPPRYLAEAAADEGSAGGRPPRPNPRTPSAGQRTLPQGLSPIDLILAASNLPVTPGRE